MTNYIYRATEVTATIVERIPLNEDYTLDEAWEVSKTLRNDTQLAWQMLSKQGAEPELHAAYDFFEEPYEDSYLVFSNDENYEFMIGEGVRFMQPQVAARLYGLMVSEE